MKLDEKIISSEQLLQNYEFYSYNHAIDILTGSFLEEWDEIKECLVNLKICVNDIKSTGGNKSSIPKKIENYIYPKGWKEIKIAGDLHINFYPRKGKTSKNFSETPIEEKVLKGFIDGHNIDFLKNRVAFDVEWNSKDQTFDRDLLAMRTYYDCDVVSVGIILTRAEELNDVFDTVYCFDSRKQKWVLAKSKYGASTTWMGKLVNRLDSRRNGGCPILAIGIKKGCISDWDEDYIDKDKPDVE